MFVILMTQMNDGLPFSDVKERSTADGRRVQGGSCLMHNAFMSISTFFVLTEMCGDKNGPNGRGYSDLQRDTTCCACMHEP
jgi:hypothetical protein